MTRELPRKIYAVCVEDLDATDLIATDTLTHPMFTPGDTVGIYVLVEVATYVETAAAPAPTAKEIARG